MANHRLGVRARLNEVRGVLNGRGGERAPERRRRTTAASPETVLRSRPGRLLSHAGHVWTLLEIERQKEQRYSREARLTELNQRRNPSWRH